MKKSIEYIKDLYQTDPEGFIGSIAIAIFGYILIWHICPIILGLWKLTKQNFKMKQDFISAHGIAMIIMTFGQELQEKKEYINQNFNN